MYRILTLIAFVLIVNSCGKSTSKDQEQSQAVRAPTEEEISKYVEKVEAEKARIAEKEAKRRSQINALKLEDFHLAADIYKKTKKMESDRTRLFHRILTDTLVQWTLDIERAQVRIKEINVELEKMGVKTKDDSGVPDGVGMRKVETLNPDDVDIPNN